MTAPDELVVPDCRPAALEPPAGIRGAALEFTAVIVTLACVWLMAQEQPLGWPIGILGCVLYIVIFHRARLYSDVLLQVYFLVTSIWGWYCWTYGGPEETNLPITALSWAARLGWLTTGMVGIVILGYAMERYTRAALPYWDATTTVLSLIAQYLLAAKVVESWALWVTVDVIAIGVYRARRLYQTMALYVVLLLLAANGLREWLAKL